MEKNKPHHLHGWVILGATLFIYGFGVAPAYYSWGFFLREGSGMSDVLDINDTQRGMVSSFYRYVTHLLGPLVAMALMRWGARPVMTVGACIACLGFGLMSRANSFLDCVVAYSLIGGLGVGLSGSIATKTVVTNWFAKFRARALSILAVSAGTVGMGVIWFDELVLRLADWRAGWLFIAGASACAALVAATFIRHTPEEVGLLPDGKRPGPDEDRGEVAEDPKDSERARIEEGWTTAKALATPQFYLYTFILIPDGLVWGVLATFLPRHLDAVLVDLPEGPAMASAAVAAILGLRVGISLIGRAVGGMGDFFPPRYLLGIALLLQGIGTAGLLLGRTQAVAYGAVALIGLGYGASSVTGHVLFAAAYGRRVFASLYGVRFFISTFFSPSAPIIAGFLADRSGSHDLSFQLMTALCLVAAAGAFLTPRPALPTASDGTAGAG